MKQPVSIHYCSKSTLFLTFLVHKRSLDARIHHTDHLGHKLQKIVLWNSCDLHLKFKQKQKHMTPFYLEVQSPRQEQSEYCQITRGQFHQFSPQLLFLNQEQIYKPNMNTIEHHFHGESDVHIFWNAMPVFAWCLTGTRCKSPKNNDTITSENAGFPAGPAPELCCTGESWRWKSSNRMPRMQDGDKGRGDSTQHPEAETRLAGSKFHFSCCRIHHILLLWQISLS